MTSEADAPGKAVPEVTDPWVLAYEGFHSEAEGLREALCALGNGRFVTRGAASEVDADDVHYPGTYVAGGYNQLASEVAGRSVVNEDLVNLPNWLPLSCRAEDGDWLTLASAEVLEYRQELRLREGVLWRSIRFRDPKDRVTTVESRRLVHMHAPHLAAIEYTITPQNWSGGLRIRSGLDGSVTNSGVPRYRQLSNRHLELVESGTIAPEGINLVVRTSQSHIEVAESARTRLFAGDRLLEAERLVEGEGTARIAEELKADVRAGQSVRVEKVVTLYTSRDRGIAEAGLAARLAVGRAPDFQTLLDSHRTAWESLWHRHDVEIEMTGGQSGDAAREQMILRLHVFHLLQTVSRNTVGMDVGAPARGLHGEAYRGHIFWDEIFVLPLYNYRAPSITRSLLLYRYHRLDAARELAREAGYAGAMYPWQSSSDGREATQQLHLNPRSGRWDPDFSRLQRHVNGAIVYNIWRYHQATDDRAFLREYGAEMIIEIARFWARLATLDEATGRFEIVGVMGPDEYHEKYPGAAVGGLRNNAYTNLLAVWCLLRALEVREIIGAGRAGELATLLGLQDEEWTRWEEVTRKMTIPCHGEIVSQFEGYDELEEFDWAGYRTRYGNIERLDRILKAEGDSPDRYQVSKQADVDMLFYLFDVDELHDLFSRLGYDFDADGLRSNVKYYMDRTSHGSTLSKVVFASVLHHLDCDAGCELFLEALRSDIDDIQGGTTSEGIHLGAMAGTVGIVLERYAGLTLTEEGVRFRPELPARLRRIRFRVSYHGTWLNVELSAERLVVTAEGDVHGAVPVAVAGKRFLVEPRDPLVVDLAPAP